MAGYKPGHLDREDSKAFIASMMRRQHRSLSAGEPSWVGQHPPEEMQEFIAGRMRLAALCLPAAQPVGASAVVEQASATVGGRGGDASPVSPAYSSGTIDLGLDDFDDEVGTHPVSFFWKALLLIRITQNGRRPAPGGAHRNWTYIL